MERFDALKNAITEDLFLKEPLAMSIMLFLDQKYPDAYLEIKRLFEKRIENMITIKIKEALENDKACVIDFNLVEEL